MLLLKRSSFNIARFIYIFAKKRESITQPSFQYSTTGLMTWRVVTPRPSNPLFISPRSQHAASIALCDEQKHKPDAIIFLLCILMKKRNFPNPLTAPTVGSNCTFLHHNRSAEKNCACLVWTRCFAVGVCFEASGTHRQSCC